MRIWKGPKSGRKNMKIIRRKKLKGRCACGKVRYRLLAEPMRVHCCHCTDCQRHTGSAFVLNAIIETSTFIPAQKWPGLNFPKERRPLGTITSPGRSGQRKASND